MIYKKEHAPKTGEFIPAFYRRDPWRDLLPTLPQGKTPDTTPAKGGEGVKIETI